MLTREHFDAAGESGRRSLPSLEESRRRLLEALGGCPDLALLRSWGNRGDDLIMAGMRSLLRAFPYREYDLRRLDEVPGGGNAVVSGGGSWCKPYHVTASLLPEIERRFSRVIVFPSSFDIDEPVVWHVLSQTRATVFARELWSYDLIRSICDVRLAHDTSFFFDFGPYRDSVSKGVLDAFRQDLESTGRPLPPGNRDISNECETMDEWLWEISRHARIRTDRAHVTIAGAMLGKQVEFRPSSYHKVPAIVEGCLSRSLVRPLDP